MKVDPNLQSITNAQSEAVQGSKTTRAQDPTPGTDSTQADGSDTVHFSQKFAEVQQLTAKLQQVPEVRSDRVSMLKEKIQQGTYKPDASDIAGAMLSDSLGQGGKS
jgi:flagellar biosynthesis anti-sigma factor FlgM